MRPFFTATYVHVCIVWKLTRLESCFFNSIWWGPLSSNVFTICAVYGSLGRRGYFGVSNVVLVQYYSYMPKMCFKNCRICMFSIKLGNHIFVSVLIIYLRMTLTLFGIEAFPTLPITWVIPVYFGQQIVIKWLLMSLSCKFLILSPSTKW